MTTPTTATMSESAPAANREVAFLVGKHFSGEAVLDTLAWDMVDFLPALTGGDSCFVDGCLLVKPLAF